MSIDLTNYAPYDSGLGANVTEGMWRRFGRRFTNDGIRRAVLNNFNTFGDSTGMHVKVDSGDVIIQGQWGTNNSIQTLPIANNTSGAVRLDLVVLRNDFVNHKIVMDVLTGSSPTVAPTMTQSSTIWEIQLAVVAVPNGAVTIASTNVTYCPALAENFLGGQLRVNALTGIGTSETVALQTPVYGLKPSSLYRIFYYAFGQTSSPGVTLTINIRANSLTGPIVSQAHPVSDAVNGYYGVTIQGLYTTTAFETASFLGTMTCSSGFTVSVLNPSQVSCELAGPSTMFTTV